MANTIMPTVFSSGVRRMRTLSGWPMLGAMGTPPDQTTIAELVVNGGYDMGTINMLITMGASNEQLQALPYPASANERAAGITNLMNQVGGAQAAPGAPATSAGSYPQAAIPTTIDTAFGRYDLMQQWSWDAISGQFIQTQQQLNALARSAPKDADVKQMVQDFNSLVGQYASYYQQAFGSAPSNIPLASFPTMSGLGIAPAVIIGGIAAAVLALLGTLYLLNQRILAKAALVQAQGASQTTANVGTLSNTYAQQTQAAQAAYAAGNKALGDQLAAQAQQTAQAIQKVGAVVPAGSTDFSAWFQQNWGWLMLGLGAIIIVPAALRKR